MPWAAKGLGFRALGCQKAQGCVPWVAKCSGLDALGCQKVQGWMPWVGEHSGCGACDAGGRSTGLLNIPAGISVGVGGVLVTARGQDTFSNSRQAAAVGDGVVHQGGVLPAQGLQTQDTRPKMALPLQQHQQPWQRPLQQQQQQLQQPLQPQQQPLLQQQNLASNHHWQQPQPRWQQPQQHLQSQQQQQQHPQGAFDHPSVSSHLSSLTPMQDSCSTGAQAAGAQRGPCSFSMTALCRTPLPPGAPLERVLPPRAQSLSALQQEALQQDRLQGQPLAQCPAPQQQPYTFGPSFTAPSPCLDQCPLPGAARQLAAPVLPSGPPLQQYPLQQPVGQGLGQALCTMPAHQSGMSAGGGAVQEGKWISRKRVPGKVIVLE